MMLADIVLVERGAIWERSGTILEYTHGKCLPFQDKFA